MKVISQSEATKLLKTPYLLGLYSVHMVLEGGVFEPKLNRYNVKPLFSSDDIRVSIVEDFYFEHGNGD